MNPKRITLAIAILSTVATALAAVGGLLPPQWALLVGAVGSGVYGIMRTLQKRAAGETWKKLLSTTEAWGAALVVLAAIVTAVAGVVPIEHAAGIAGIAAALLKVARVLQAALPGDVQAPKISGPGAIALLALGAAILFAGQVRAGEPLNQLGPTVWRLTFRPTAIVGLGQLNLSKGTFSGGIAPGACYGATLDAGSWYAPSVNACLAFQVGQSVANSLTPGVLLGFADYYYVGAAAQITEVGSGEPMDVQWMLRFSVGLPISGTPTAIRGKIVP